jgi:hypothetical protein
MYLPATQTESDAKKSGNSWTSAYGYQYSDFTYTYYFGGVFPTTIQVRVEGSCYIVVGTTSGNMARSGYYLRSVTVDRNVDKPNPFYWISSSQGLEKGTMEVSKYITASKWLELRNTIDAVHEYKGTTRSTTISTVTKNTTTILASHYIQMKNAINELKSGTITVSNPVAGQTIITASIMMALQTGINNVINSLK